MGARQRRRMAAHFLDAGEMRRRRSRVVEKTQRNPARHEMALDARVLLGRLGSVRAPPDTRSGHRRYPAACATVSALNPPFLRIIDLGERLRGGQHHLRGFGDLVLVAQNVHAREDIAGIVVRFRRHGFEQLAGLPCLCR